MEAIEIAEKPWLWNGDKAKEMSAKANEVRWSRFRAQKANPQSLRDEIGIPETDPLRKETLEQIRQMDEDFKKTKDVKIRIQIATAKDKLWRLIFPSPGSLKPKAPKSPRANSSAPEPE